MTRTKKILNSDIINILVEYKSGRATQQELARRYNVTQSCISRIIHGKRQGGLGFELLKIRKEARHGSICG